MVSWWCRGTRSLANRETVAPWRFAGRGTMLKQPDRLAGEGDRSVRKLNGGIAMQEFADGQTTIVVTPDGRRLGVCVWGDPEGAPLFWLHGTPGAGSRGSPAIVTCASTCGCSRTTGPATAFPQGFWSARGRCGGRHTCDRGRVRLGAVWHCRGLGRLLAGISRGGLAARSGEPVRHRCRVCSLHRRGARSDDGMDEEVRQYRLHTLQGEAALEADWRESWTG